MNHYALLDENNIVTNVFVGYNQDQEIDGIVYGESYYSQLYGLNCRLTNPLSYAGKLKNLETGELTEEPGFRKNYAGIGYYWNETKNAFIPPKPAEYFVLNEETCLWENPIEYPNDGKLYSWDEESLSWIEIIKDSDGSTEI